MRVTPALAICVSLFVSTWWLYPHIAESAHTPAEPIAIQRLAPPAGFTATDTNDDTAFRKDEAGFSAYYRVPESEGSETRLDIDAISNGLVSSGGGEIRGLGRIVELGLNFSIVELPVIAAVGIAPAPTETVTVYYDDTGWVVAYLPKDRPAAAIWKHDSADDETVDDPKTNEHLENNLLVLAINEVLKADDVDALEVSHDDVKYYDWENQTCDAFVLFSAEADGVQSNTVKFVVPGTIKEIGASAAVALTEQIAGGDDVTAEVEVDGEAAATANGTDKLAVASFELDRESDKTSLHTMVVDVSAHKKAAGVVMLVYNKPDKPG